MDTISDVNILNVTSTYNKNITVNMTSLTPFETSNSKDVMMIFHSLIASVGVIANLTVVVVFLNHRKLRRKIPNIFIINQVSENECV